MFETSQRKRKDKCNKYLIICFKFNLKVDTPFVSHLLDLPFGTYIFKEDGGIRRKIVPPPTPASTGDLSLTNGVEVDMDKFLSPDIDLISLPHLTNLDFNSICN